MTRVSTAVPSSFTPDSEQAAPCPCDGWIARLCRMAKRRRQRRALGELDERLLRDVGIAAEDARTEADKPFWK
jgi:uncharacterized protein YjiS (DUF1127 family)